VQQHEENETEEKMNSLISMSKTSNSTATLKNDPPKIARNDPKMAQELDLFADMQPVIEATNLTLISAPAHDKFAVVLDEVDNDEDGWNDVNDEAWS
jgi:hypothetical protein